MAQSNHGIATLRNSVNDYYQFNPDTLMPLLMLALASQGKLQVGVSYQEGSTVFASIRIDEVKEYEWVKLNPALKKRLKEAKKSGAESIFVSGDIPTELKDIYDIFYKYDNETVVQEYHHRLGILADHSSNASSENAQRQYATIMLAEEFCAVSEAFLKNQFLFEANNLLVKSGLQPKRPRIRVAQALCALLSYDGKGVVYNPFAGCAIAGAMIGAGGNLYADGDVYDKLVAVAKLLCYGTGQRGYNIEQRDSTKWLNEEKPDYVLSTFLGYPGGKSAFDFCLGKCLENFKESGKYAGIVAPKDIFENQSPEMKDALNRDWIDSIVLLPFGEVAVLVDAAKTGDRKKKIRFYNLTHPMLCRRPIMTVIGDDDYADILKVSDVKKKGYLKSLVIPEIEKQEGCEIITLGDIFEKVPRQTWALSRCSRENRVMAKIDRTSPYDEWRRSWMNGIVKEPILSLLSPAYKLDEDCLIVNSKGFMEPRLFDSDNGYAFFQDGYAFKKKYFFDNVNYDWLIHELNMPYVEHQLHPYGIDEMLPESFTEEQVLSIKLNRPIQNEVEDCEDEEYETPEEIRKRIRAKDSLKPETVIHGNNIKYTIHGYLGAGSFGYTYTASSENLSTGDKKEVVLKEFYPDDCYHRDGYLAVRNDYPQFDIDAEIIKFHEEENIMHRLGEISDSHIVPAKGIFDCEETGTPFYIMPFYERGSLLDNQEFRYSESMTINHIVIPLCKALSIAHREKVLHLDIKPENILIDDNGDAILIDFGVAKQYGEDGNILKRLGTHGTSEFAAPEMATSQQLVVAHFGPQPDIFGLAASIYKIITGEHPRPIQ